MISLIRWSLYTDRSLALLIMKYSVVSSYKYMYHMGLLNTEQEKKHENAYIRKVEGSCWLLTFQHRSTLMVPIQEGKGSKVVASSSWGQRPADRGRCCWPAGSPRCTLESPLSSSLEWWPFSSQPEMQRKSSRFNNAALDKRQNFF